MGRPSQPGGKRHGPWQEGWQCPGPHVGPDPLSAVLRPAPIDLRAPAGRHAGRRWRLQQRRSGPDGQCWPRMRPPARKTVPAAGPRRRDAPDGPGACSSRWGTRWQTVRRPEARRAPVHHRWRMRQAGCGRPARPRPVHPASSACPRRGRWAAECAGPGPGRGWPPAGDPDTTSGHGRGQATSPRHQPTPGWRRRLAPSWRVRHGAPG